MPTVLRREGFRFAFFSDEGSPREPSHVHVSGGGNEAKIWLEPDIAVAENYGFNARDLNRLVRIVREERQRFLRAWHEHFR
ncbi:MAG TPA: DUF4160 domain-containing protein [Roseiarcus sp.]|nr:DUF4160 domain-containing protein [Roseiarcus sp.]